MSPQLHARVHYMSIFALSAMWFTSIKTEEKHDSSKLLSKQAIVNLAE